VFGRCDETTVSFASEKVFDIAKVDFAKIYTVYFKRVYEGFEYERHASVSYKATIRGKGRSNQGFVEVNATGRRWKEQPDEQFL